MPTPLTVDAYLAGLDPDRRERIETIRRTVAAAAPDAVESIAYQMPAFRSHGGQFLVSFGAWKRHDSLFPANPAIHAYNELTSRNIETRLYLGGVGHPPAVGDGAEIDRLYLHM